MSERRVALLASLHRLLHFGTFIALVGLVVDFGFPVGETGRSWIRAGQLAVVGLFAIQAVLGLLWTTSRRAHLKAHWVEVALLSAILLDLGLAIFLERSQAITSVWFLGVQLYLVAHFVLHLARVQEWLTRRSVRPALLLLGSYVALALVGAGLLWLPRARPEGVTPWSFTDAFFTSTSAVCVTGLSVRDVGSELTVRGQLLLLMLIQIGGIGLVTIACGAGLLQRGKLGVRELNVVTEALGIAAPGRLRRFLAFVVTFTLMTEAIGAATLWWATRDVALGPHDHVWWSVFHAVSAFCNAGFGLSERSLVPWSDEPAILLTIAALIVIGGLGFGVHMDILARRPHSLGFLRWLRWRLSESVWWPFRHRVFQTPGVQRLSLNARLVLVTTLALILIGALLFYAAEARHVTGRHALTQLWLDSLFQSITARTAGFNSVDIPSLQASTLLLITVLMVVGASPLSTGGGVRTTTLAIALLTVRAMTRDREQVEAFGRSIARPVVNACIAIVAVYATIVTTVIAALLATQSDIDLGHALFETVSAVSTVGLSNGLTAELDDAGRLILCAAMIAGRIGPVAVLWAFASRPRPLRYRYPEEPVVVA